jgi:hypothetical protein
MTKCIATIVANINKYIFNAVKNPAHTHHAEQEDHTDAIDCALAALNMDSELGSESDTALVQIATAPGAADHTMVSQQTIQSFSPPAPQPGPDTIELEVSSFPVEEAKSEDVGGSVSGCGRGCGCGQGRARGKKAAVGVVAETCATRSHK